MTIANFTMNITLLTLLLWIWDNRSFNVISTTNKAKIEGEHAYSQKKYRLAAVHFNEAANASLFTEPEIRLDLAHALFKNNEIGSAKKYYSRIAKLNDNHLASHAQTQLGVIAVRYADTLAALENFKKALILNPDNEIARFDYELLRKKYSGKAPVISPKPVPKQTKTNETLVNKAVESVETKQKKDLLKRLNNMKLDEKQALIILDAMKASEIQYLQQREQKSKKNDSKGRW